MFKPKQATFLFILFNLLFFTGLFFYLWLCIDPYLYYVAKEPFFQLTTDFFMQHLLYPGGITDYLSIFLSQFFFYPLVGTGIITIVLMLLSLFTYRMIGRISNKRQSVYLHLIPPVLCLALQSNYYHPLAITIGIVAALAAFYAYTLQKLRNAVTRVLVYLVVSCFLYYCAGGVLLLFAVLCLFWELLIVKNKVVGLLCIVVAGCIPLFAAEKVFLVSINDAYLHTLPFAIIGYKSIPLICTLYAMFPALFLIPFLTRLNTRETLGLHTTATTGFKRNTLIVLFRVSVFIVVFVSVACVSYNHNDKTSLTFCKMYRNAQWTDIVQKFQKTFFDNRVTNFTVASALFNMGLLPTHLFMFPQNFNARGLFLFGDANADFSDQDDFYFMYRCDLFFKMGLLNEAQQWGYEALSVTGKTGWALMRLAQIHALKGEFPSAMICLHILETSPMHQKWAKSFEKQIADSTFMSANPELRQVYANMPKTDYIRKSAIEPCLDLKPLLAQNPHNKMAFEYCMASYMLLGNIPEMTTMIPNLDTLGYAEIPRLYQEAFVLLVAAGFKEFSFLENRIQSEVKEDYKQFYGILQKNNNDLKLAEKEILATYWNTYWYYYFYILSAKAGKP